MTWTIIELGVYLIAVSILSLCPLMRRIFKDAVDAAFFTRL